jgi:hypothetical protein
LVTTAIHPTPLCVISMGKSLPPEQRLLNDKLTQAVNVLNDIV